MHIHSFKSVSKIIGDSVKLKTFNLFASLVLESGQSQIKKSRYSKYVVANVNK